MVWFLLGRCMWMSTLMPPHDRTVCAVSMCLYGVFLIRGIFSFCCLMFVMMGVKYLIPFSAGPRPLKGGCNKDHQILGFYLIPVNRKGFLLLFPICRRKETQGPVGMLLSNWAGPAHHYMQKDIKCKGNVISNNLTAFTWHRPSRVSAAVSAWGCLAHDSVLQTEHYPLFWYFMLC